MTKETALKKKEDPFVVQISPPNFRVLEYSIKGTAPYVQAKFSAKSRAAIRAKHEAGSTSKKGVKKEPRDFQDDFRLAQHISEEGWNGIPAAAFRNACIDVCRMVNFRMNYARMSVFFLADGVDADEGSPLIKIEGGKPEMLEMATRNATGVADLRVRPMWRTWSAKIRLRYDADQFTANDVTNLLSRAGVQIGVGEGRPYSKSSNGLGFGTFEIV